ncbi:hypothetical protein D9M73_279190 [compost metagenome]
MQRFLGTGDGEVATPFLFAFVVLLLALELLQCHQFGLPGGRREHTDVGRDTMPVRRFAIPCEAVEAVNVVSPAL